jgi:hypothetical protein
MVIYFRRQHLCAVFVTDVFKDKVDSRSMTDSVGLRVPTKQNYETFQILLQVMIQDFVLHLDAPSLYVNIC